MESLLRCGTKNRVRVLRRDELSVTTLPRHTHAAPALAYDSGVNLSHNGGGGGLHIAICNTPLLAPPDIPLYKKSYILLYYPKN